ncbi:Guanine deaminase [Metarhizium album ARSEF 1941]|uniref:Probable guanine deaminase n=1 Tax=Metarhizium album (strain ARSEF 1941) TaxID=1081103 RepID=A0A0B2WJ66_METAS|nr:Guanine deaminase [Metarhizium album ARSEF 1941]KHN96086.1 Guanine deaminase [Metarhizium album ARSEF 1941]
MTAQDWSRAFHGVVIHTTSLTSLTIVEDALLTVSPSGRIASLEAGVRPDQVPSKLALLEAAACPVTYLQRGQFLMPGFVDTHHHAPQWLHRGQGQGLHILEWLDQVAFPNEARFEDASHAQRVYGKVVEGMLRQGVTTASYYGSKHGAATKTLADICLARGQRALVGKCNMSRNAPDYYRDADEHESLAATLDCIHHIRRIDPEGVLVRHALTPRFAICCDAGLLSGLGDLARRYPDMPIQTHFNESEQERRATLTLFPGFSNEADLYQHFGLLNDRSILAHCTIMTDYETRRLARLGCGVAHCPTANMTVGGGFMAAPVRDFLRSGIKVGLGTDSGGGYSSSMLDAMRHSLVASFARDSLDARDGTAAVSLDEAFHMATLGGAQVVGRDADVGNFQPGKAFDALVVDVRGDAGGVNAPLEDDDSLRTMLEKFVMTGDDRNIRSVFVGGTRVHGV